MEGDLGRVVKIRWGKDEGPAPVFADHIQCAAINDFVMLKFFVTVVPAGPADLPDEIDVRLVAEVVTPLSQWEALLSNIRDSEKPTHPRETPKTEGAS